MCGCERKGAHSTMIERREATPLGSDVRRRACTQHNQHRSVWTGHWSFATAGKLKRQKYVFQNETRGANTPVVTSHDSQQGFHAHEIADTLQRASITIKRIRISLGIRIAIGHRASLGAHTRARLTFSSRDGAAAGSDPAHAMRHARPLRRRLGRATLRALFACADTATEPPHSTLPSASPRRLKLPTLRATEPRTCRQQAERGLASRRASREQHTGARKTRKRKQGPSETSREMGGRRQEGSCWMCRYLLEHDHGACGDRAIARLRASRLPS